MPEWKAGWENRLNMVKMGVELVCGERIEGCVANECVGSAKLALSFIVVLIFNQ